MRPRRLAAENPSLLRLAIPRSSSFNEAAATRRGKPRSSAAFTHSGASASMRPRRLAAENKIVAADNEAVSGKASMRPRRLAAENWILDDDLCGSHAASMRPRRLAAENRC